MLRRGLLEPSVVASIVAEVSRAGADAPESIWSGQGRLGAADLESVLRGMAETAVESSAPMPAPRGAPADFRYSKLSVLGVGGMGRVDECLDTRLGRRVAMKRVKPELADRARATALLAREAKVTGNLEHPNIVPVYDFGDDSAEGPYYVMRIVDHASLSEIIDRLAARDPETFLEFTLARLLRVMSQVCNAIEYAHSRGFAHADLKPANILLGAFGQVHVVDWGIAAPLGEVPAFFAGTPGYVAPERVEGALPLDPRSDVFSLGAVLYEVLCQRRALSHRDTTDLVRAAKEPEIGYRVAAPSTLPCAFEVPEELELLCLRALAVDPEARFPTAAALGKAIDRFLEGTLDKERRAQRARELVELGEGLEQSYHDLMLDRPRRTAELVELRASVPPWAPEAEKQALWDAEDGFAVLETLRVRTLHEVVSTYEQALEAWHGQVEARAGLARVYAAELRRAQERRDHFERLHFEERLRQVTGDAARPSARIAIDLIGEAGDRGAEVQLLKFIPKGRRWVLVDSGRIDDGATRVGSVEQGSYVVRVTHSGRRAIDVPVLLRAGDARRLEIDTRVARALTDDEAFVSAGPALLGDDEEHTLREVVVPAFAIQRRPVTFAQYLEFVVDVSRAAPASAIDRLPRTADGEPMWTLRDGVLSPEGARRWGLTDAEMSRLPAVGIDAWSADAYAAWWSKRVGRPHRLPTEDEWEKAARGVDGRLYPWGDEFDPSFCKMRESRAGIAALEESGAFEVDVSVYGVVDMAGGVADWAQVSAMDRNLGHEERSARRMVSRGGAYCDPRLDCRASARRHLVADERTARVGFRLVRPLGLDPAAKP